MKESSPADKMIEVVDLHKRFKDLHVLKGISTVITRSEVVAIMGPSGGGKSTFLRCLNRLEEPTSGHIYIEGVDIMTPYIDINKVRTEIGMVFQSFNLFPHLTAIENIKLAPMHVRGISDREATERGMALLEKVGLTGKALSYPEQLSGGQQQRVAIARALAMQPQIMFFDEPTSALDPEMIGEVLDVMRTMVHEGMTMVLVSHEMGFIREAADRILFLADGVIVEEGPPEQIFRDSRHPRTQEFLRAIL
jgi:ABC-type polar amino acid transport system ATPase subunit